MPKNIKRLTPTRSQNRYYVYTTAVYKIRQHLY